MKNAYSFHPTTGKYLGVDFAQESPLEAGVYLLPAGATFIEPPQITDGHELSWNGESWKLQMIPTPEIPEPEIPEPEPAPEPEPEPAPLTWDDIRSVRNGVLTQCDWTQLADAPLTTEQRAAWASYRQQIRAVPQTFETPEAVVWPSQPTE
jgi:hypothetical protein